MALNMLIRVMTRLKAEGMGNAFCSLRPERADRPA